jgi:hypothetical protein
MNLWQSFTRKTTGGVPWAIDTLPVDTSNAQVAPGKTTDFAISMRWDNGAGWASHRLVVGYHGPVGAASLPAQLYVFDKTSQRYYTVGASVTLVPESLAFFSMVSTAPPPVRNDNLDQTTTGGTDYVLIVTPTLATTNGSYVFSMAPDTVPQ